MAKKSYLKLDPYSERYRICPECNGPFMASHRTRQYCSDKHHNDFHNRKKRESVKMLAHLMLSQKQSEAQQFKEELRRKGLEENIRILSNYGLSEKEEKTIFVTDLIEQGYKWPITTHKYLLPNTTNSWCLEYGDFKVYHTTPDKLLIYKKQ